MDPISAGLGIVGLGLKIFGGLGASEAADKAHQAQMKIFDQEQDINANKYNAMFLASRRQQLDILRNQQRARALALNAATNQGAQFGTGLQGGLAQVDNASNENLLANAQSLDMGRNIAQDTNRISYYNMQVSNAQTDMSNAQGMMSLGGSLMAAGPTIGNLTKGLNVNSIFGGGSPSGYGR